MHYIINDNGKKKIPIHTLRWIWYLLFMCILSSYYLRQIILPLRHCLHCVVWSWSHKQYKTLPGSGLIRPRLLNHQILLDQQDSSKIQANRIQQLRSVPQSLLRYASQFPKFHRPDIQMHIITLNCRWLNYSPAMHFLPLLRKTVMQ